MTSLYQLQPVQTDKKITRFYWSKTQIGDSIVMKNRFVAGVFANRIRLYEQKNLIHSGR